MLKITESPDKLTPSNKNGSKSASNRNNNSRPASKKNNGDGKVDGFGIGGNSVKHTKKSRKLSKSGKSKSEKMSKSQNLAESGKKLSKSGNLTKFDATEDGPKFLTLDARTAFNCLWLAFTKVPIL